MITNLLFASAFFLILQSCSLIKDTKVQQFQNKQIKILNESTFTKLVKDHGGKQNRKQIDTTQNWLILFYYNDKQLNEFNMSFNFNYFSIYDQIGLQITFAALQCLNHSMTCQRFIIRGEPLLIYIRNEEIISRQSLSVLKSRQNILNFIKEIRKFIISNKVNPKRENFINNQLIEQKNTDFNSDKILISSRRLQQQQNKFSKQQQTLERNQIEVRYNQTSNSTNLQTKIINISKQYIIPITFFLTFLFILSLYFIIKSSQSKHIGQTKMVQISDHGEQIYVLNNQNIGMATPALGETSREKNSDQNQEEQGKNERNQMS